MNQVEYNARHGEYKRALKAIENRYDALQSAGILADDDAESARLDALETQMLAEKDAAKKAFLKDTEGFPS